MFLFTKHISNRHGFVARLLSDRLGIPVKWVDDPEYLNSDADVVVYDSEPYGGRLTIYDSGFLSEKGLRDQAPEFKMQLFPANGNFIFDFDLFSAVFYVVSRYEEYFKNDPDKHGRFKPEKSYLYTQNLLNIPIADEWIYRFGKLLTEHFEITLNPPQFRLQPTIDVDVAYAYLGRPFWLTLAGYARDVMNRRFKLAAERFRVNTGLKKDPYDTYNEFKKLCAENSVKPAFFFQLGTRDKYDKNLYPLQPLMTNLINDTAEWAELGIHPSYRSNDVPDSLQYEMNLFHRIVNMKPTCSRQHYLRFSLPETFQRLAAHGVEKEYSMGYAHVTGFRAGTCHPFPFFDLTTNTETELIIKPFVLMDGTLKDHLKLGVEEAKMQIEQLIKTTRNYHGEFIFIWHNSSLDGPGDWQNWYQVLEHIFKVSVK
ncbi:polysaccharide deacetylase family protein [Saccharicrinis sp. FJH54]|uniref:polysaccharide deacetylase family protein n=1 Tax=Saccharicrinis sp. FJH54 TaxID=3344665 RepID=UPI0035D452F9